MSSDFRVQFKIQSTYFSSCASDLARKERSEHMVLLLPSFDLIAEDSLHGPGISLQRERMDRDF
jgi:hypothetical protein